MMTTMKIEMEVKQVLKEFKLVERESFNDVVKRLIIEKIKNDNSISEIERKGILKAIISVEKGRTQSFEQMMKDIQKKRTSTVKRGELKNPEGKEKDVIRD